MAAPPLRDRAREAHRVKALAVGLALAATAGSAPPPNWHPGLADAIRYAQHRHGEIAFAGRTPGGAWGWHQSASFPSASVLKAMLLVAYLDLPSVQARPLRPSTEDCSRR